VAVKRPVLIFPRGQVSTGSNGLIGGFKVTLVTRVILGFVGDELRNNLTKASVVYYIYIRKFTCRLHWSEICYFNPVITLISLLQISKLTNL